jgi:hypothetical protein
VRRSAIGFCRRGVGQLLLQLGNLFSQEAAFGGPFPRPALLGRSVIRAVGLPLELPTLSTGRFPCASVGRLISSASSTHENGGRRRGRETLPTSIALSFSSPAKATRYQQGRGIRCCYPRTVRGLAIQNLLALHREHPEFPGARCHCQLSSSSGNHVVIHGKKKVLFAHKSTQFLQR